MLCNFTWQVLFSFHFGNTFLHFTFFSSQINHTSLLKSSAVLHLIYDAMSERWCQKIGLIAENWQVVDIFVYSAICNKYSTRESKRKRYGNRNENGRKNMFFGACTKSISPIRRLIASPHWNHLRIGKSIINCVYVFLGSVCPSFRLSHAACCFRLFFNRLFKKNIWFRYANTTFAVQQK